jgi:hypothetical protein
MSKSLDKFLQELHNLKGDCRIKIVTKTTLIEYYRDFNNVLKREASNIPDNGSAYCEIYGRSVGL